MTIHRTIQSLSLLLAVLLGDACAPVSQPSSRGYELEVINATLFLPEFEQEKRSLADLTFLEMRKILGEKKCVFGSDSNRHCYLALGKWNLCESPQIGLVGRPEGSCMPIRVETEKITPQQLLQIQDILLDFCKHTPRDSDNNPRARTGDNEWFGCLPGTKRQRWYSYLLHDEHGNLLMLIDPKTKTVKKF